MNNCMTSQIIMHRNIPDDVLCSISLLKDELWTYGIENQKKWMEENLKKEDFHFLYYKNLLVGYLNLVNRKIILNEKNNFSVLGVGNVCIKKSEQGLGLGGLMIQEINSYLKTNKQIGVLLCKTNLVDFYKNNNWNLIPEHKFGKNLKSLNVQCMIFNFSKNINTIDLIGSSF